MRLAILADVHGNLPALEAVFADLERYDVVGIIVAGDLVGGPHPVETMRLLRARGSTMIRGNSDNSLVLYDAGRAPSAWYSSQQYALLRWTHRRLDRETLDSLSALPEQRVVAPPGTAAIRVVHGSPRQPAELLLPDHDPVKLGEFRRAYSLPAGHDPPPLEAVLALIDEPVLVCGHSHIPWKQDQDGRLTLNPGAVCGPLNGDVRAQYALLSWQDDRWQVEHRAVSYDLERIRSDFRESGLLGEGGALARAFLLSTETGRNVAAFFLNYAYRLAAEAGYPDCDVVPDGIWEEADATWDWSQFEKDHGECASL